MSAIMNTQAAGYTKMIGIRQAKSKPRRELYCKHKKEWLYLVELIVVLVILAVLAALLVPALTGYIDKARKSQVIAETRMLTQAAQTELSSLYATN